MYPCTSCPRSFDDRKSILAHIRDRHSLAERITCPFCDKDYTYDSYRGHLRNHHDPPPALQQAAAEEQNVIDHAFDHGDDIDVDEVQPETEDDTSDDEEAAIILEEIFVPPEEAPPPPDPNLTPMENFLAGVDSFREKCFEKWLQFSSHPDATEKIAGMCCDLLLEVAADVINIVKPLLGDSTTESVLSAFQRVTFPLTSEYRRKQHLNNLGLFVEPKRYVIDVEHVNVRTEEGVHIAQRKQTVAMPSIRESLLAVLSTPEIANELVMPSDFTNSVIWDHPFCGSRTQNLLETMGEDFLVLQLFMDEFTTTCPIGSQSTTYKMAGCYIRLLNFPVDLLSKLNLLFLCFLGHATEIMGLLQLQLSKTVVVELKQLENEGIMINYHGTQRRFKVILQSLAADNLGHHQLGGLILSFASHNCCRMCNVTADTLKPLHALEPDGQKTVERYDELVATNDLDQMWTYGIRSTCAFNTLEHFHVMRNVSVDIMHDLLEGHFQRVIPMVLRDAIAHGHTLRTINNAIKAFQFFGPDNENPPNVISLPAHAPENGDSIKMSANQMSIFIKLLPLIFHFAGIRLRTRVWTMFMKLQRIIDILWAHKIDETTTALLDRLIQNHLKEFHDLGGNKTVKAHLALHYPRVIREMGPLRFLSSMRFEAFHQPLKLHAKVIRCHKNIPMSLSSKNSKIQAFVLHMMRKGNYVENLRSSRSRGKYKGSLAVVYGQNETTKEPIFGEIQSLVGGTMLHLHCLTVEEFDEETHCFIVQGTSQTTQIAVNQLLYPDPLPIYAIDRRYIRLREHLL